jgi:hypothetical protein
LQKKCRNLKEIRLKHQQNSKVSYQIGMRQYAPSPAPVPANSNPQRIAEEIINSAPVINEQVLARAVMVVANVLVGNGSTGSITELGPRAVVTPQAVRSQTPSWISNMIPQQSGQVALSPSPPPKTGEDIFATPMFGPKHAPVDENQFEN